MTASKNLSTKSNYQDQTGMVSETGKKIKNGSPAAGEREIITPAVLKHISEKYLAFVNTGSIPF